MTYEELLEDVIRRQGKMFVTGDLQSLNALVNVVRLHKPELDGLICGECTASESEWYPCPTIQSIERGLQS